MKSPPIAPAAVLIVLLVTIAGCAPFPVVSNVSKPLNSRQFAPTGEVVLRVGTEEYLPAPSAGYGYAPRTRDRGFAELTYVGLTPAKQPIFRRRECAPQAIATPGGPAVITPPEATSELVLDYSRGRTVGLRGYTVEVIDATPAGVTFTVY